MKSSVVVSIVVSRLVFYVADIALLAFSLNAGAQQYSVTNIGTLGGTNIYGAKQTEVYGFNASGEITGWSYAPGGLTHAFLWSKGVMHDLGTLTNTTFSVGYGVSDNGQVTGISENETTYAFQTFLYKSADLQGVGPLSQNGCVGSGINNNGQVVGAGCGYGAFLYTNGVFRSIGFAGNSVDGNGIAINNTGEVAGWSSLADNSTYHAFLYIGGKTYDLGTLPGGTQSQATAISSNGLVAGTSTYGSPGGYDHAFLYTSGTLKDLGSLGGPGSWATGVNRVGNVVGSSYNSGFEPLPFLYSNGKMVNLNSLLPTSEAALYTITDVEGINDNGQIAAGGHLNSNPSVSIGLLLTPLKPSAPLVTQSIAGTQGANGWYVSSTTLSWLVTGEPAPTESGCGKVSVPETKGTRYTCTATNEYGTASHTATIKRDTVAPTVKITEPTQGATYNLNQKISASYVCADTISGVAKCVGTVISGADIATSVPGSHTFTVTAIDEAGNQASQSGIYTVK